MALQFMHPAFLWGLLLAALPVVIHLLNRRRLRRVEFPAIAFLLRSQQRNARRLRLRRLLLLAARTLLLLAVPLALARPYLAPREVAAAAPDRGPAAVAIVLDTSMSMRWRDGDEPLFEKARAQALKILDALPPEDAAAVLPCADGWPGAPPKVTYDAAELSAQVRAARAGWRGTDMNACVAAAARTLSESPLAAKRLVVVGDLTASGWRLDAAPPTVTVEGTEARPEVIVVDVARGRPLPNRWIEGLATEPALSLGPRGQAFGFTVRGAGGASAEGLPARLVADGQVLSQGFVDLAENGTARKTLSHAFPRGGEVAGEVRLEPDALPDDDVHPWLFFVQRDVRALVVDGAPSLNRYEDEAFFVERALSPGRGGAGAVRARIVDFDGLAGADLSRYDLVLLLDVHQVPASKVADLEAFVREGGGLFVSAGPNLDVDAYNADLGGVLPAELHVVRSAEGEGARLGGVRWHHPVFGVFQGEGREGFASARFRKYLMTQPPRPGAEVVAAYEDGTPALLVGAHGRGRVALYTSTVDRDWTDFPIRTAFLPTLQQLSGWLARALDERREAVIRVGDRHGIPVPPGAREVVVHTPDGRTVGFKGEALAADTVAFDQTGRPGVYRVTVDAGARPATDGGEAETAGAATPGEGLGFVVVTDPRESDTTRLAAEELTAWFGGQARAAGPALAGSLDPDEASRRRPLWSWLLALGVLALVAEGWLLRR